MPRIDRAPIRPRPHPGILQRDRHGRARSNNEDSVAVARGRRAARAGRRHGRLQRRRGGQQHGHLVHQDRTRALAGGGVGERDRRRGAPRDGHLRRQRQPRDLQRRQLQPAVRGHGHDAGRGRVPRRPAADRPRRRLARLPAARRPADQATHDHSLLQEQIDAGPDHRRAGVVLGQQEPRHATPSASRTRCWRPTCTRCCPATSTCCARMGCRTCSTTRASPSCCRAATLAPPEVAAPWSTPPTTPAEG